jgi:hypothetical protein
MQLSTIFYLVIPSNRLEVLNGSMQNGTVCEAEMLGTISKQYARLNVKRMDFGLFVGCHPFGGHQGYICQSRY